MSFTRAAKTPLGDAGGSLLTALLFLRCFTRKLDVKNNLCDRLIFSFDLNNCIKAYNNIIHHTLIQLGEHLVTAI